MLGHNTTDKKHPASPSDLFPSSFTIGSHKLTKPLVSIEYVKAHLALLGAFADLKERIETCAPEELPDPAKSLTNTPEAPRRWVWFVTLAVERFHRWAATVTAHLDVETWAREEAPPLDVLMVWHSYMLNPAWYAEDCVRLPVLQALRALNNRLLPAVIAMGDPAEYQPTEERQKTWSHATNTPFDPIEALKSLERHELGCPRCEKRNAAPYLMPDGTGYAQKGFQLPCVHCDIMIDKSALAMDKFARDLVKDCTSENAKLGAYLPGTLRTPTDMVFVKRAQILKNRIVQSDPRLRRPSGLRTPAHEYRTQQSAHGPLAQATEEDWMRKVKEDFRYSLTNVHTDLRSTAGPTNLGVLKRMVDRVMSAYADDSPFSIDLVGAVIRQGVFIAKMHSFGWTAPGYFDDVKDEAVLANAITRYHAFLDLMSPSTSASFVPTLDIDLAWHTHQLTAGQYGDDCMAYVGRFIDHDDKVEENHLADTFETTCKIWQQRFKVPYTYCGCPLPGTSIGDRLARLTHRVLARADPPLAPPEPARSATHGSDHSAVCAAANRALPRRRKALELMRRRAAREGRRAGGGESGGGGDGGAHEVAFLVPAPFVRAEEEAKGRCVPVNQRLCVAGPGADDALLGSSGSSSLCTVGGWGAGARCTGGPTAVGLHAGCFGHGGSVGAIFIPG